MQTHVTSWNSSERNIGDHLLNTHSTYLVSSTSSKFHIVLLLFHMSSWMNCIEVWFILTWLEAVMVLLYLLPPPAPVVGPSV